MLLPLHVPVPVQVTVAEETFLSVFQSKQMLLPLHVPVPVQVTVAEETFPSRGASSHRSLLLDCMELSYSCVVHLVRMIQTYSLTPWCRENIVISYQLHAEALLLTTIAPGGRDLDVGE